MKSSLYGRLMFWVLLVLYMLYVRVAEPEDDDNIDRVEEGEAVLTVREDAEGRVSVIGCLRWGGANLQVFVLLRDWTLPGLTGCE
jgi:hypothetical protein